MGGARQKGTGTVWRRRGQVGGERGGWRVWCGGLDIAGGVRPRRTSVDAGLGWSAAVGRKGGIAALVATSPPPPPPLPTSPAACAWVRVGGGVGIKLRPPAAPTLGPCRSGRIAQRGVTDRELRGRLRARCRWPRQCRARLPREQQQRREACPPRGTPPLSQPRLSRRRHRPAVVSRPRQAAQTALVPPRRGSVRRGTCGRCRSHPR
jgi:hypothetical protein